MIKVVIMSIFWHL